ncbi:hypothetical protein HK102_003889 [Quaeritorhiza haematococci]|nr:hypothetical protein HK102_003889 [Quaeritorhiza haematococci]
MQRQAVQRLAPLLRRGGSSTSQAHRCISVPSSPLSSTIPAKLKQPSSSTFCQSRTFSASSIQASGRQVLLKRRRAAHASSKPVDLSQQLPTTDEDESEALQIPPNVTPEYFRERQHLVLSLIKDEVDPAALRNLCYQIQTKEDAKLFLPTLTSWHERGMPFDPRSDSVIVLNVLMRAGAYEEVLELLCDRWKYRILVSVDDVHWLMANFREEHVAVETAAKDEKDEARLASLDNMYKCFAVLLYYDIPPTADTYSLLITSGIYGGSKEGLRRSDVTAKESRSLGLSLTQESAWAMAYAYIREGDLDAAMEATQEAMSLFTSDAAAAGAAETSASEPTTPVNPAALGLRMEACVGKGDLRAAVGVLERIASEETLIHEKYAGVSRPAFGSEWWTPVEEVVSTLFQKLEAATVGGSADPSLILRAKAALKTSARVGGVGSVESLQGLYA